MDDYPSLFRLTQQVIKVFDPLKLVCVVLTLQTVRNVNVSGDVVRDEAAASCVGDSGEVIKCIVFEALQEFIVIALSVTGVSCRVFFPWRVFGRWRSA